MIRLSRTKLLMFAGFVVILLIFIFREDLVHLSQQALTVFSITLILLFFSAILYGIPRKQITSYSTLSPKDKGELENEFRKTLAQIIGGAAILLGLYFTAMEVRAGQERQTTERYHWAVTQLGSDEPVARLGGIYTLARIARESEADQRAVVKILTSFIRYHRPLPSANDTSPARLTGCATYQDPILFDVQAAIDVLRDRRSFLQSEGEEYLDLSRADLRNANLSRIDLRKANLRESLLEGVQLVGADLTHADLYGARLDSADLSDSRMEWTQLSNAALCGTRLRGADLNNAVLTDADLSGARISGAVLRDATLKNTNLERVTDLTAAQLQSALVTKTTRVPPAYQGLLPVNDSRDTTSAPQRCTCLVPTDSEPAAPELP